MTGTVLTVWIQPGSYRRLPAIWTILGLILGQVWPLRVNRTDKPEEPLQTHFLPGCWGERPAATL